MPSRISGACNGCRTKKQKCSGDRSGCTQCHVAGITCTWPEQRKRGPAKGYIEGLEHRLHEAETLLLQLLPLVSTSQLITATSTAVVSSSETRDTSDHDRTNRSSPPVLNKKTGIEYWENFPLDTADNVRRWQSDCATNTHLREETGNSARVMSRPPSVDLVQTEDDILKYEPVANIMTSQFRNMRTGSYPNRIDSNQHPQDYEMSVSNDAVADGDVQQGWYPNQGPNRSDALLLQNFSEQSWPSQSPTQEQNTHIQSRQQQPMQSLNAGIGGGDSEMIVDSSFFSNELQRRLFW